MKEEGWQTQRLSLFSDMSQITDADLDSEVISQTDTRR